MLTKLLAEALDFRDDDRVIDYAGRAPWGDLSAYRDQVHKPLHGNAGDAAETQSLFSVEIAPSDVKPIREVLDGLAESVSGAVPWVALTAVERAAVMRIVEQLKHGQ